MKNFRFASFILCALLFSLSLTGCLSHWFIETDSRLQVENGMDDCTFISLSIADEDSSSFKEWIRETVLPGERSHVVAGDWVGKFNARIRYTHSTDGTGDTLTAFKRLEFEGGSLFLVIENDADTLTYRFK